MEIEKVTLKNAQLHFTDSELENIDDELKNGRLRWYHLVPFANFVYEVFFHAIPTIEGLEKMLMMLSLIDSLLLAVICTVPSSVSFAEIQDALGRWSKLGYTSWSYCTQNTTYAYLDGCSLILNGINGYSQSQIDEIATGNAQWYIYGLPYFCSASMTFFSMSLGSVIVTYLSITNTPFSIESSQAMKTVHNLWWQVVKYLVVATFLFTILGLVFFYFAMHRLYFIKFPSYFIETEARVSAEANGVYGDPQYSFLYWVFAGMVTTLLLSFFTVSAAIAVKNWKIATYFAANAQSAA